MVVPKSVGSVVYFGLLDGGFPFSWDPHVIGLDKMVMSHDKTLAGCVSVEF